MPVLIDAARARLRRHLTVHEREILAGEFSGVGLPLHPPTAAAAAADVDATKSFVHSWEGIPVVEWVTRNWSSVGLGQQPVPVRLQFSTAAELIGFLGAEEEWTALVHRKELFVSSGCDESAVISALPSWRNLPIEDCELACTVVEWFHVNPSPCILPRAVPVEGVHTKWLENHRVLVEKLVAARSGVVGNTDLGLESPPATVRLRFAPGEGPAGLRDVEVPLSELASLPTPQVLVMVENLSSFLPLPLKPGQAAVWGAGWRAVDLVRDPWLSEVPLVYWGDLDTDGYGILSAVRGVHGNVTSVLMGPDDVNRWLAYAVADRDFQSRTYPHLTAEELQGLEELITRGHLRIEQERIRFDVASAAVGAAVHSAEREVAGRQSI